MNYPQESNDTVTSCALPFRPDSSITLMTLIQTKEDFLGLLDATWFYSRSGFMERGK
jgi:hypothetical protein